MSKIRGRSSAIGSHGTVWVPWAFPIQELRLREETQALGAGGVPATSFHRLQRFLNKSAVVSAGAWRGLLIGQKPTAHKPCRGYQV